MRTTAIILGTVCLLIGLTCVVGGSFWMGQTVERRRRYLDERDLVAPILASEPAYADVKVVEATGRGGILLWGPVKGEAAFERLKAELVRLFGEPKVKDLLGGGFLYAERDAPAPKPK